MATEADIKQVKVFCAFRGETRSDDERSHVAQGTEVKGQCSVVLSVGEGAAAVAARMFLTEKRNYLRTKK